MKKIIGFVNGAASLGAVLLPGMAAAQEQPAASGNIQHFAETKMETVKELINIIIEFVVKYSFQVFGGIVVLVAGWIISNYLTKFIAKLLQQKSIDVTVAKFMVGAVKLAVMTFAVIVALGKFGIEIAPLIAGISVVGFGTSFALQGPLSNYASGVTLIFTKPFKVGEIIEVAGVVGEVIDMKLPRTELKTVDGTVIVIPNKHIIGEIIHNFSTAKRLDINVGVSYGTDVDRAIGIVRDVIKQDPRVVREPNLGISEFADSSVNIYARVWCRQDDYWQLLFDINHRIFSEFKKQGVEIPFPQRDVHIVSDRR